MRKQLPTKNKTNKQNNNTNNTLSKLKDADVEVDNYNYLLKNKNESLFKYVMLIVITSINGSICIRSLYHTGVCTNNAKIFPKRY